MLISRWTTVLYLYFMYIYYNITIPWWRTGTCTMFSNQTLVTIGCIRYVGARTCARMITPDVVCSASARQHARQGWYVQRHSGRNTILCGNAIRKCHSRNIPYIKALGIGYAIPRLNQELANYDLLHRHSTDTLLIQLRYGLKHIVWFWFIIDQKYTVAL